MSLELFGAAVLSAARERNHLEFLLRRKDTKPCRSGAGGIWKQRQACC